MTKNNYSPVDKGAPEIDLDEVSETFLGECKIIKGKEKTVLRLKGSLLHGLTTSSAIFAAVNCNCVLIATLTGLSITLINIITSDASQRKC